MRETFIVILFLIFNIGHSQCDEISKIKNGYSNIDDKSFRNDDTSTEYFYAAVDTTENCCALNKIDKYAKFILLVAKQEILKRANKEFYNKLIFEEIIVYYHEYKRYKNFDEVKFNLDDAGKISYWINYEYKHSDNVNYGFGLGFNKDGELITKDQFPSLNKNPNALNLIDFCKAVEIVKSHPMFRDKEIDSVEIYYDNLTESFCWLFKEDGKKQVMKLDIEFEKWYEYSSSWAYVDISGQIEVTENTSRVIFSGIKAKKKN